MHMNQTYDVYISYSRSDGGQLAKIVCDYLLSRGIRVYLDTSESIDRQYFVTQLRKTLIATPNYLLIATPDVFRFRNGEAWLHREMSLAVSAFKKRPRERSVIPIVPYGTVFPEYGLPGPMADLPRFNRIYLENDTPTEDELLFLAKAVCRVNRMKMWKAGLRFLKNNSVKGSRSPLFRPEERISPLNRRDKSAGADEAPLPMCVTFRGREEEYFLHEALQVWKGSLCLIGEQGMGKTTAMLGLMEKCYRENSFGNWGEIPLYVDLSKAAESAACFQGAHDPEFSFIRRELARLFLGVKSLSNVPEDYISNIDILFSQQTEMPEYLLLLDGLSEMSAGCGSDNDGDTPKIRYLIFREIHFLMTECPNVRIMLTSRSDVTEFSCADYGMEKIYLTGLDQESVAAYLSSKAVSSHRIREAMANDLLRDSIRNPLYLAMFAVLKKTNGVSSRAEIMSRFFNELSERVQSLSTPRNLLNSTKKDNLIKGQYRFIISFLLPAIASEMERKGCFRLTEEEIVSVVEPILKGRDANGNMPVTDKAYPCSVIGEYGKQCLSGYKGSDSLPKIASSLLAVSSDIAEVTQYILAAATDKLGVLCGNQPSGYGFAHSRFRDYFAAAHDVVLLRIALQANAKRMPDLAFESLAPFNARPISPEKTVLISEIFAQQNNTPNSKRRRLRSNVPDEEDNRHSIEYALEIFRERFGEKVGYGVYNLIELVKQARQDLSEMDFSELDLSLVTFNGCHLGCTKSDGAYFQGAKISMDNFISQGHSDSVESVAYAPDGRSFISGSDDHTVREWDIATGNCIRTYAGHSDWVNSVAYAPDGKSFISGSRDHTVVEWDIATGHRIRTYAGHSRCVTSVAYAPDGKSFISGSVDKSVREWDVATGQCIRILEGHSGSVFSVAYAPDGLTFLSGSVDETVRLWDAVTGQCIRIFEGHTDWINAVVYAPDGMTFLSGAADNTVREWDIATGQCICTYGGHSDFINSVAFAPDGRTFLSESYKNVMEWDRATGRCIRVYKGHSFFVNSVAYAPDGNTILSGAADNSVKEWDRATGRCIRTYQMHKGSIRSAVCSPDGGTVIAGGVDHTLKEWEIATGRSICTYEGHSGPVTSVAFSPDGMTVLSGSMDHTVLEWDITTGQCIRIYERHRGPVNCAVCSPDGMTILSGSMDHTVMEWDRATGQCILTYRGHADEVNSVAFSPDGRTVLSGSGDFTVMEWDRATGQCIRICEGHRGAVRSVAYAPDGMTFLSGAADSSIKEWDKNTGQCIQIYEGHGSPVNTVAYSPDGTTVLSGHRDKTVKEWDRATGQCIKIYEGHRGSVESVVYAPDGKTFFSGSEDATVRVWSTETGECLRVISHYPGLIVPGCDMRNLHEESAIDRDVLRQYGAIVD